MSGTLAAGGVIALRLPRLAPPTMRDVARHPISGWLAMSDSCEQCFAACARLPVFMQGPCKGLCAKFCN